MRDEINTVDLFCGAGGATTGLELALKRLGMKHKGLAINHWQIAVETMKENHPTKLLGNSPSVLFDHYVPVEKLRLK